MRLISPIYWSPLTYRLVMRLLYGRRYQERYASVAELIPAGSRVVELCCGCGYLYEHFLHRKHIEYLGIDLLPQMLGRLRRLGARVEAGNLLEMQVPSADLCVMLGSLYHFHPREAEVIRIMAASSRAILLEPVHNLSGSRHWLVKKLSHHLSYIGQTSSEYRLDSERLKEVLGQAGVEILSDRPVLNGKYRLLEFCRQAAPQEQGAPLG